MAVISLYGRGCRVMDRYFSENLRILTNNFDSISDFCRKIGINRQQFNKYLSGQSLPSPRNMRRLCSGAGLREGDFFLPPAAFTTSLKNSAGTPSAAARPLLSFLEASHRVGAEAMKSYAGVYFKYYYSLAKPQMIRKSLLAIRAADSVVRTKCVEPPGTELGRFRVVGLCKYHGEAFYLGDRLLIIEYDYLNKKEITYSVLFPNYMSNVALLPGLMLGVSAGNRHDPASCRILLEKIPQNMKLRKALQACGLFSPECDDINGYVKHLIDNGGSPHDTLFLAHTIEFANSKVFPRSSRATRTRA
jgi:transcriptional regulator with XRE-family HTH domain